MSPRARTQSRRHAVAASAVLVLGLGAALAVFVALGDGSARAAVTPDHWAPVTPHASDAPLFDAARSDAARSDAARSDAARSDAARSDDAAGDTPRDLDAPADDDAESDGWIATTLPNDSLDSLTPDQLHNRIDALGWVFVGKGRHSETPQASSVTWVVAHPPGIDAVVTLYRFESQAYLEAVRPFVEAQDEVQIARGERTLLYVRIRRNPKAAQTLLADLQLE